MRRHHPARFIFNAERTWVGDIFAATNLYFNSSSGEYIDEKYNALIHHVKSAKLAI